MVGQVGSAPPDSTATLPENLLRLLADVPYRSQKTLLSTDVSG